LAVIHMWRDFNRWLWYAREIARSTFAGVAGFLSSLAYGPSNNTSQTNFPNYADPVDATHGSIVQDRVDNWLF
jgi:hypothetical protein